MNPGAATERESFRVPRGSNHPRSLSVKFSPPMIRVEQLRGSVVESSHTVHVAVVDREGRLVARAGDPDLVTFWRSAAKPFQAMPLVADGVVERFKISTAEVALCCASHSSEPDQVALVRELLAKIGCSERDLLCGAHPPLSERVAQDYATRGVRLTAVYSNCSGKHAGMLALARHHGWPTEFYTRPEHPVQERLLSEMAEWSGVERSRIGTAKVGAEGVYCGLLTQEGHGVALKVEDGHTVAAALAMAAVLAELGLRPQPPALVSHPTVNTRGETVGELRVNGGLSK